MVKSRPNVWQLQSRRDVHGLIVALEHPDPEVRKRAAVALRTLDATQAVGALKTALRTEANPQVRVNLATALHILDHRTDVARLIQMRNTDGLIQALKSRNPENVIAAAQALGQLNDRTAVEPLIILFQNSASPPQVRLAAAEALLDLKSAPAVVTLIGALRRDSWQVRRNAAAVLGQIQAIWAVEPLAAALNDPHPIVRRTAAAALRRIGTAEAVAALRAWFSQSSRKSGSRSRPTPSSRLVSDSALPMSPPATEVAAPIPPEPEPVPAEDTREVETLAPAPQQEPPLRITQPVMKLISFLKQRNPDKDG